MSEQSLELLQSITRRLHATARRMTLADLLFGLALTIGVLTGALVLSTAIEAGLWLGTLSRTVLFWSLVVVILAVLGRFLAVPLFRFLGWMSGPPPEAVARRIGAHYPQVSDRLVNLLDLSAGRRSDSPDALVDGAVRMLGSQIHPVPFEQIETFERPRRALRFCAVPLVSLVLFLAAAPDTFLSASKRLLSPGATFEPPAPFQIVVRPGSADLAKGAAFEIEVELSGRSQPNEVLLALNDQGEEHVEEVRLAADSTGVFRHRLANVRRPFRYRAAAAPVASPWFEVSVAEHPLVRNLQVALHFPSYAGIPSQRLDPNVGDVTGLPGTRVEIDVDLDGSASSQAFLEFDDGSTEALWIEGRTASGSFRLTRKGSYRIILENDRGVRNLDPITYGMNVVTDAAPSIILLEPESDAALNDELRTGLLSRINDDYGFRDLKLYYRLAESRFAQTSDTFEAIELPLPNARQLDQEIPYDWRVADATSLDPVPGDVIEYFLEVRDNDAYAGFKAARTAVQRLLLPSLAEQYEALHERQDDLQSRMEEARQEASDLSEQFQELQKEIRQKQDADWEDKRQLQQIQDRQKNLEDQVNDLAESMRSMNESAEENNLLTPETMELYDEMQKVIEEINSPELMEALQKLQQSLDDLDLSQMQQSMEDFEFNEEQYKERLERALELFKNLRAQQGLEEAARRAEELARQQERLAEETQKLLEQPKNPGEQRPEAQQPPGKDPQNPEGTPENEESANQDPRDAQESKEDETKSSGENESKPDSESNQDNESARDKESTQRDNASEGDQPVKEIPSSQQGQSPQEQDASKEQDTPNSPSDNEKLAREQELSSEEMQQLEKLLDEIRKEIEQLERGPGEQMQQLNESVRQQEIPQQMQRNAEQLRQERLQDAQSGQQQMQQQLQQLQAQLQDMRQGMQGRQMEVNMAGLRRALSDVLTLSQQQEDLRAGIRKNVSEAPALREDTRRQVELSEGLSVVADSLQQLAKNIPQMSREVQRQAGEALRAMTQATEAMSERAVGRTSGFQKTSMMHLNELALLLSEVMNQMMNGSGSGEGSASLQQMIQQLQQMSEQQSQLNQQIQEFLNDMQGNRLNVDMQARLQQMARQQQAIKRQLDQIRRNPESRGKLLGDLEKIGQQMEETIRDLQQRHVDREMIERQQQILTRLLDAQRSINQRGKEKKREGTEGRDIRRDSPGEMPPEEEADKLRRDLIRALESGYAPDYEELIKRYFELLQKQATEQE